MNSFSRVQNIKRKERYLNYPLPKRNPSNPPPARKFLQNRFNDPAERRGRGTNEQTNITRKRGHEGPEFPRMNEHKRRRRQRGRGKTAAVSTIVSDRQVGG